MALQELSTPPPVTGYAQLGQQLANFGQQARAERLKTADEERQVALEQSRHDRARGEQLADIGSARKWEVETEDRRSRQAAIQVLINEGFLNADDKDNEESIKVAQLAFQQAGLAKKYMTLLTTPDENGNPLLSREDLGDIQKVKEAETKLQGIAAKENLRARQEPEKARQYISGLRQRLDKSAANVERLQQQASEPLREYSDQDPAVYEQAKRLAENQKPGSGKNVEAVRSLIPKVLESLNARAFADWRTRTDSAKMQLEAERYRAIALTTAIDHAQQIFKVAPDTPTETAGPGLVAPPAAALAPAAPNSVAGFVESQKPPPAAPPPAAAGPLRTQLTPDVIQGAGATPEDLSNIAQADASGAATLRKTQLQDPLVQETRDLQALQQQLTQVRQGKGQVTPWAVNTRGAGSPAPLGTLTPQEQGTETTRLLQAIAAKARRIQELTDELNPASAKQTSAPTFGSAAGSIFSAPQSLLATATPNWLQPASNQ